MCAEERSSVVYTNIVDWTQAVIDRWILESSPLYSAGGSNTPQLCFDRSRLAETSSVEVKTGI